MIKLKSHPILISPTTEPLPSTISSITTHIPQQKNGCSDKQNRQIKTKKKERQRRSKF